MCACQWNRLCVSSLLSSVRSVGSAGHWSEMWVCGRNKSNASLSLSIPTHSTDRNRYSGEQESLWIAGAEAALITSWVDECVKQQRCSFIFPFLSSFFPPDLFFSSLAVNFKARFKLYIAFASGLENLFVLFNGDILYKGKEEQYRRFNILVVQCADRLFVSLVVSLYIQSAACCSLRGVICVIRCYV